MTSSTAGFTTLIGAPARVRDDLVEDVGELDLVLVARDVADVRRADDVVHREQRMARCPAPALPRRRRPRPCPGVPRRSASTSAPGSMSGGAARVDEQRRRLHAREVAGGHDAARRVDQAHVQRDDVALLEEGLLAARDGVAVGARARERGLARPDARRSCRRPSRSRRRRRRSGRSRRCRASCRAGCCRRRSATCPACSAAICCGICAHRGENQPPGQLGRGIATACRRAGSTRRSRRAACRRRCRCADRRCAG